MKGAHITGLFFGFGQFVRFLYMAIVFYIAAKLVLKFDLDSEQTFTGVYVVFIGAIGSGTSLALMPSIAKAQTSARKIFDIMEEKSEIDARNKLLPPRTIENGEIVLRNVSFKYPSRTMPVISNMELKIPANESVALVGHSGSGKSTIA